MFKRVATDLNRQPVMMQQTLTCDSKMPCCFLMVAVALMVQVIRSSLEQTGNMKTKDLCGPIWRIPLVWGLVTWEDKPQARTVQSSDHCKWWWGVLRPEVLNMPQPSHAGTTCFSWGPTGFPSETPGKSVHQAVRVTSKAQSKNHAQCPSKRWPQSVVGVSELMQH